MSPKLAVVTVTYSPGEHLENFLSTLAVATTEKKPQVIMPTMGRPMVPPRPPMPSTSMSVCFEPAETSGTGER